MAIENVRDFFGIKYVIPYNRTTFVPYMILRAIGELSFENQIEANRLEGGHGDAPWDVEYGQPQPSFTGTLREYPHQLFSLLETATITENSAEANGAVTSLANGQGTTVFDASNGISAIAVKTAQKDNLPFGRLIFRATAAQTVEVLVNGLYDGFNDHEGQAVASVDCATPGTVDIDALGVSITVSGTAAFTTGDTAYCEARPENSGSKEILVGSGTAPTEFGLRCVFPRKADGVMHWIDIFRVSGRGLPWKAASREWSEFDINWVPLLESDNSIYRLVRCFGVNA